MVQTKKAKAAYARQYRLDNKEKVKARAAAQYAKNREANLARQKIYNTKNKEKIKEREKKYYQDNKEHFKKRQSEYQSENREMILKKAKEYRERPEVLERQRLYALTKDVKVKGWIRSGLLDDYDMVWDRYCNTEFCDDCRCQLIHEGPICSARKCMDHSHKTGKFRNILCHKCNHAEHRKIYKNRKKGTFGIHKKTQKGVVTYSYKCEKRKHFKSKIDCMCYKYIMILKWRANQRSGQNFLS